jgi:hypothetical protein
MLHFKTSHLLLILGVIAPASAFASTFCVAVDGGFGGGGTSYIGPAFAMPSANGCKPWAGFTKTGATVIATATGTGCLSSNGKVLTLSIFDTNPDFFGSGVTVQDQIRVCPNSVTNCPIVGNDQGNFSGSAEQQTCTDALLKLPTNHG